MANIIKADLSQFENTANKITTDEIYKNIIRINNSMVAMRDLWKGDASEKFIKHMMEYLAQFQIIYNNIDLIQKVIKEYPIALEAIEEAYANKKLEIN